MKRETIPHLTLEDSTEKNDFVLISSDIEQGAEEAKAIRSIFEKLGIRKLIEQVLDQEQYPFGKEVIDHIEDHLLLAAATEIAQRSSLINPEPNTESELDVLANFIAEPKTLIFTSRQEATEITVDIINQEISAYNQSEQEKPLSIRIRRRLKAHASIMKAVRQV